MGYPRRVVRGATYFVTRRTVGRRFFTVPTKEVQEILLYCLAVASEIYGIQIHSWVFMSTHVHLVFTDVEGNRSDFYHWFFKTTGAALNSHHERKGSIWDEQRPQELQLMDAASIKRQVDYTLANPIAAGLVRELDGWNGSVSLPEQLDTSLVAKRPTTYFRQRGKRALPAEVSLEVTVPSLVKEEDGFDADLYVAERQKNVESAQKQARRDFEHVLGRKRCERQSMKDSPSKASKNDPLRYDFMCEDKETRDRLFSERREWRGLTRQAWLRHKYGDIPVAEARFPKDCWRIVGPQVARERAERKRAAEIADAQAADPPSQTAHT
jgi:putative transposase